MFTPTNTKIYAKRFAGYYHMIGQIMFPTNGTGVRYAAIRKNGAAYLTFSSLQPPADDMTGIQTSTVEHLSVDDYLELYTGQNSGGDLDTIAGSSAVWLTIAHLSGR